MKKGIVFPKGFGVPYCVDVPEDVNWEWMRSTIGVEWIEIVHPRRLPRGFVMIVDEEGLLKPNEPNYVGSWFYETDKHGSPIVGNVLILKEVLGDEGPECAGMDEAEIERVFDAVHKEE